MIARLVAATALAAALAPAPAAAAGRGCAAGVTQHEAEGVRVFEIERRIGRDSFLTPFLYACSERIRRPTLVTQLSPATTTEVFELDRVGNRLALQVYAFADGGGGSELGWFDVRTGRRAFRHIDNPDDVDFGLPILAGALARKGSLAYVVDTDRNDEDSVPGDLAVYVLRYASRRLAREKLVATVRRAELDPATLALGGDRATWRTVGAERSVPIPARSAPAPAKPRRPRAARLGCESPATTPVRLKWLTDAEPVRIFRVTRGPAGGRGLFVCRSSKRARTMRIGPARARLEAVTFTSRHLAFVIGDSAPGGRGVVGWFEPRTGEVRTTPLPTGPYGTRDVAALALDGRSGIVLLRATPGAFVLSYLRASGRGFASEEIFATLAPGDIEPTSLTVKGGKAVWRTVGESRSAALGS